MSMAFTIGWVLSGIIGSICVFSLLSSDQKKLDVGDLFAFLIMSLFGPIIFVAGVLIFFTISNWSWDGIDNPFYKKK